MCGRCYDFVDEVFPPRCAERPERLTLLGMYHCPDCGAMLIGGLPHPDVCRPCLDERHPHFDTRH